MTNDEQADITVIDPTDPDCAAIMGRINGAIADTDALIDSYLSRKYNLPLDPIPDVINTCAKDIAIYKIHTRKMPDAPAGRKADKDAAVRVLERIADGKQGIGENTEPAAQETATGDVESSSTAQVRRFTVDSMGDF